MRKYSLEEIDQMRAALRTIVVHNTGYYMDDYDEKVERQLRTLMMNGTAPTELEHKATMVTQEYHRTVLERQERRDRAAQAEQAKFATDQTAGKLADAIIADSQGWTGR